MNNLSEQLTSVDPSTLRRENKTDDSSGIRAISELRGAFNEGVGRLVANPVEREMIEMQSILANPTELDDFQSDLISFISLIK